MPNEALVLVAAAVLEARDQPSTYNSRRPGRHVPTMVADYVIALALCRRLGARRFESETLIYVADVERASGRRFEALKLLKKALAISRETGTGFFGPAIGSARRQWLARALGALAWVSERHIVGV